MNCQFQENGISYSILVHPTSRRDQEAKENDIQADLDCMPTYERNRYKKHTWSKEVRRKKKLQGIISAFSGRGLK